MTATDLTQLRVLAKAAASTAGVERVRLLERLIAEATRHRDHAILDTVAHTTTAELARQLGISRQAAQQRVQGAHSRLRGGS